MGRPRTVRAVKLGSPRLIRLTEATDAIVRAEVERRVREAGIGQSTFSAVIREAVHKGLQVMEEERKKGHMKDRKPVGGEGG